MSNNIDISEFESSLIKICSDYGKTCNDIVEQVITDKVKQSTEQIKKQSPKSSKGKKRGGYAKGWRSQIKTDRLGKTEAVIYNKTDYQLVHLLEYGHAIVKGGRTIGRAQPIPHVEQVQKQLEQNILRELERELKK